VPQILGTVPWVALTGTGAVALTAFAIIHGNDAPAKIAEILDLTEQLFPAQLQIAQWLVHSASYLNVGTHSDYRAKKEKTQLPPTKLAHTHGNSPRNLTGQEACKFVAGKETNK